jgi:hypothetical protein
MDSRFRRLRLRRSSWDVRVPFDVIVGWTYGLLLLISRFLFIPLLIFFFTLPLQLRIFDLTSLECFLAVLMTTTLFLLEFTKTDIDVYDRTILGKVNLTIRAAAEALGALVSFSVSVSFIGRSFGYDIEWLDTVLGHAVRVGEEVRVDASCFLRGVVTGGAGVSHGCVEVDVVNGVISIAQLLEGPVAVSGWCFKLHFKDD